MFVKIEDFWLNTDQIVSLKPHGKSFRVNLSDGEFLALRLPEYLILVKAMKIKQVKPVRKKSVKRVVVPVIPEKTTEVPKKVITKLIKKADKKTAPVKKKVTAKKK